MVNNLAHRKKARVVAIVDLIVTSIFLVLAVCLLAIIGLFMTAATEGINNQIVKIFPNISSEVAGYSTHLIDIDDYLIGLAIGGIIVVIVVSFCLFLEFIAAIKLLNATQVGKEPLEALRLARFWKRVTIVFTVLAFLGVMKQFHQLATNYTDVIRLIVLVNLFNILVHLLAIYIVHQFITQLEKTATTPTVPVFKGQPPMSNATAYSHVPIHQSSAPPLYMDMDPDPLHMQIRK